MKIYMLVAILLVSLATNCYATKYVNITANFDSWSDKFGPQAWISVPKSPLKTVIEPMVGDVTINKKFLFGQLKEGGHIKFEINSSNRKYTQHGTCSVPIKTYSGKKALKSITLVFKQITNSPVPTHFFQCELEQKY
ncbi:MAG TPA: hypothetical protein VMW10_12835 [Alphaproteobacteria bacterium]|nr:hypothetical protein [Alphaproteobacteria bacterium]